MSAGAVRPFTVVVGVSASSGSPAALRWAAAEAAHHGGVVIAVRAWRPARTLETESQEAMSTPDSGTAVENSLADQAQSDLEAHVRAALGPDSAVECRLVHGGRRKVLRSLSRDADLLVIDAPQRSDLSSPPLFARRLIHTASCPVVVMPPRLADLPDTPVVAAGKRIGHSLLTAAGTAGRPGVRPPLDL